MRMRTYYLSQLLVAGAAVAMIAVPTASGDPIRSPGGTYCGAFCGTYNSYNGDHLAAAAVPVPPRSPASQPWVPPAFPSSHALPIVSAAGDPIHQR
jgi:hypothetical protein